MKEKGIMELYLFFQYSAISVAFTVIYDVQHLTEDAPDNLIISSRGFKQIGGEKQNFCYAQ